MGILEGCDAFTYSKLLSRCHKIRFNELNSIIVPLLSDEIKIYFNKKAINYELNGCP